MPGPNWKVAVMRARLEARRAEQREALTELTRAADAKRAARLRWEGAIMSTEITQAALDTLEGV